MEPGAARGMLCDLAARETLAFTLSWALTVRGARGRAVVSAAGRKEGLHALLRQMLLFPSLLDLCAVLYTRLLHLHPPRHQTWAQKPFLERLGNSVWSLSIRRD